MVTVNKRREVRNSKRRASSRKEELGCYIQCNRHYRTFSESLARSSWYVERVQSQYVSQAEVFCNLISDRKMTEYSRRPN